MSDLWITPPALLDALRAAGADLQWDPCPAKGQLWGEMPEAADYCRFNEVERCGDGMSIAWPTTGHVWVNPPYSGDSKPAWIRTCADRARHGSTSWLILPASTQEVWFRKAMALSWQCWFIGKRVRFVNPVTMQPGTRPANGSVVFQFGPRVTYLDTTKLIEWGGFIVENKRMIA